MGAPIFSCISTPSLDSWTDKEFHVAIMDTNTVNLLSTGAWTYSNNINTLTAPFKIRYTINSYDGSGRGVFGLGLGDVSTNGTTNMQIVGYRFDTDDVVHVTGIDSDLATPVSNGRTIDIIAEVDSVIKVYIDGVLRGQSSYVVQAGVEYYPRTSNLDGFNFTYETDVDGLENNHAQISIRNLSIGANYEAVIIDASGNEIVASEWVGYDNGLVPISNTIDINLSKLGLVQNADYEIVVRDKDFPTQDFTDPQPFVYSSCSSPIKVKAIIECVNSDSLVAWDTVNWADYAGNQITAVTSITDVNGYYSINPQTGSWNIAGFAADQNGDIVFADLPVEFTWQKQNVSVYLGLVPQSRVNGTDIDGYLDAGTFGIQSNAGYGAYTRGIWGNSGWYNPWTSEFKLKISATGLVELYRDDIVVRSYQWANPEPVALKVGYNGNIDAEWSSPSFSTVSPHLVFSGLENETYPLQMVDANTGDILMTLYEPQDKIQYNTTITRTVYFQTVDNPIESRSNNIIIAPTDCGN